MLSASELIAMGNDSACVCLKANCVYRQPGDFQPGGLNLTLNRELNRAIFFFDRAIPTWWSQPGGLNLVVNLVVLTEQKKREMPRGPTWWSQPIKNINVRQRGQCDLIVTRGNKLQLCPLY
jgi:hypothetical protein